jgi:putative colanic acid biosynthesis glycosyltransferase
MVVVQINTSINTGSTGRIAEEIAAVAAKQGYTCYGVYGRISRESKMKTLRVGTDCSVKIHGLESRLFDNHGFSSKKATRKLIGELVKLKPDVVHLHNIHGYYIHVGILFDYLKQYNIPVVWTLHDCWPLTGHCSYFDWVNCDKWKTHCNKCPNRKGYPESLFFDFSARNFDTKKSVFTGHPSLTLITPSLWLADIVKESFLKKYPVEVINNGVDISIFKQKKGGVTLEKHGISDKKYVLGVASTWDRRKGLSDFFELAKFLSGKAIVVLVGLTEVQIKVLPKNIIGIERTENVEELVELYSGAQVFVNPTYVDNFPTTNIEALACGTPVITYKTGGSPEAIDHETGSVVEKGDVVGLKAVITSFLEKDKKDFTNKCRARAMELFDKNQRFSDYIALYETIIKR